MTTELAYDGMRMTSQQTWRKHTKDEVDFIIRACDLRHDDIVYDFGCGDGRHVIEFAARGLDVVGIEKSAKRVAEARAKVFGSIPEIQKRAHIQEGDCSCDHLPYANKGISADAVICLYDVIGSYVDEFDNLSILQNMYSHLKPGGTAIISVMNYDLTYHIAKNTCYGRDLDVLPMMVEALPVSNIMESTGDVFNPDYFVLDLSTHNVYRKEQFTPEDGGEKVIHLVKDHRYERSEIIQLCEKAGFTVEFARYVSASDWTEGLTATDPHAKEILLKLIRPVTSEQQSNKEEATMPEVTPTEIVYERITKEAKTPVALMNLCGEYAQCKKTPDLIVCSSRGLPILRAYHLTTDCSELYANLVPFCGRRDIVNVTDGWVFDNDKSAMIYGTITNEELQEDIKEAQSKTPAHTMELWLKFDNPESHVGQLVSQKPFAELLREALTKNKGMSAEKLVDDGKEALNSFEVMKKEMKRFGEDFREAIDAVKNAPKASETMANATREIHPALIKKMKAVDAKHRRNLLPPSYMKGAPGYDLLYKLATGQDAVHDEMHNVHNIFKDCYGLLGEVIIPTIIDQIGTIKIDPPEVHFIVRTSEPARVVVYTADGTERGYSDLIEKISSHLQDYGNWKQCLSGEWEDYMYAADKLWNVYGKFHNLSVEDIQELRNKLNDGVKDLIFYGYAKAFKR